MSEKTGNQNENGPATVTALPTAQTEDRSVGRPPEISDQDVYEACNVLFQKGIEPRKINGYKLRQHFGKGTPGRFDKIADRWREENRYGQTVAAKTRETGSQEGEHPLSGAFKALDSVKHAMESGVKTLDYRHGEKLRETREKAETEVKEVAEEASERDSDAQAIIDALEKKQEELEMIIKGMEKSLADARQERDSFKALAAEAKNALDKLLPEYNSLKDKEQSIAAVERERDNALKARDRAESQYDTLKADADKREENLNRLLSDATRTRDEMLEQKDQQIARLEKEADTMTKELSQNNKKTESNG